MTSQLVAIIYDVTGDVSRSDVNAVLDGVAHVGDALAERGHRVERLCVSDGIGPFIDRLERLRPAVVFNLCEGYRGESAGEPVVAGMLELLGLPFTGSGPMALSLALNKPLAKRVFAATGIPSPEFAMYSDPTTGGPPPGFPAILKLACEDASVGITPANVVFDEAAFRERLAALFEAFDGPVMAEAYIDGREFTVALLDGEPLVLEEIEFDVEPRIVSYASKWEPGTAEFVGTRPQFSPVVGEDARARMLDLAREVYRVIGLRDFGRVDFRLDAAGRCFVLEANPNPDITPGSGYCQALTHAGVPYGDFLERLLQRALERGTAGGRGRSPGGGAAARKVRP